MQWSQLRHRVESSFAPTVARRVQVHATRYDCSCGRGWITVDGKSVASMDAHQPGGIFNYWLHPASGGAADRTHEVVDPEKRTCGRLVERDEFNRDDLHIACWQFIHQSIDASLASEHPLVQALAILDRRVGRGRFDKFVGVDRDPLPAYFAELRRLAEGWPASVPVA